MLGIGFVRSSYSERNIVLTITVTYGVDNPEQDHRNREKKQPGLEQADKNKPEDLSSRGDGGISEVTGGGTDEYDSFVGADPVMGQLVRSRELTKATSAEIEECLKQYNELDAEEQNKERNSGDGGATKASAEGPPTAGGGRRGAREGKNSSIAPVSSASSEPHRQSAAPTGG